MTTPTKLAILKDLARNGAALDVPMSVTAADLRALVLEAEESVVDAMSDILDRDCDGHREAYEYVCGLGNDGKSCLLDKE